MEPFGSLTSAFVPLARNDIDTDQIIPAVYLKVTNKDGLVDGLFARWRYLPNGSSDPDFPLNRQALRHAEILLVGDNFGCGSSREHAAWALVGWGFRVVISSSFADIFRNNALKNGLLPLEVDQQTLRQLFSLHDEDPSAELAVDLASQTLTLPNGRQVHFPIDGFSKACLLEGVDQLGYLLKHEPEIRAFELAREHNR